MEQRNPSKHEHVVCRYKQPSGADVSKAIDAALAAKPAWEALPFADRASVFLKAADLIGGKYRYEIMAATMLGQGKNAWQAEIDAAAEICDFFRSVYGRLRSHYHILCYADSTFSMRRISTLSSQSIIRLESGSMGSHSIRPRNETDGVLQSSGISAARRLRLCC